MSPRVLVCAVTTVLVAALGTGLTACGHKDTTKAACRSLRDVSFDSVVGPLYDGSSASFKHEYDKVDAELSSGADYFFDLQRLSDLCAKYGVKNAAASISG